MAATAIVRLLAKVTGLGADKELSVVFSDSQAPVEALGPIYAFITVAQLIDTVSIATTQLRNLIVVAKDGDVFLNPAPVATAFVTAACYISEGNFAVLPTGSACDSARAVWVQGAAADSAMIEYWGYGISSA